MGSPSSLCGARVLIVQRQPATAAEMAGFLNDAGCHVVGASGDLADALHLAETQTPDLVIMDAGLRDVFAAPLATALRGRKVLFAFVRKRASRAIDEILPALGGLASTRAAANATLSEGEPQTGVLGAD